MARAMWVHLALQGEEGSLKRPTSECKKRQGQARCWDDSVKAIANLPWVSGDDTFLDETDDSLLSCKVTLLDTPHMIIWKKFD